MLLTWWSDHHITIRLNNPVIGNKLFLVSGCRVKRGEFIAGTNGEECGIRFILTRSL